MAKRVFNEFGQDRITIYDIDGKIEFETPAKLHNYHLLMLTEGEITIDVNYRIFKMKPMMMKTFRVAHFYLMIMIIMSYS